MIKHFVEFLSPGTFIHETSTQEVGSWDVNAAVEIARTIKERHSARPFAFRFITRERDPDQLDSHVTARSGLYFLGGQVLTLEEVEALNDPTNKTLVWNMKVNKIERVVINDNSWRSVNELGENDTVLDVTL